VKELEEQVRLFPEYVEAYNILGDALGNLGRVDEGIEKLHQALKLQPKSVSSHFTLGQLLEKKQDVPGAIAEYETAVNLDPNDLNSNWNLAVHYGRAQRHLEAIKRLRHLVALQPDNMNYRHQLGVGLARTDRFMEAYDEFCTIVRKDSTNLKARLNAANLAREMAVNCLRNEDGYAYASPQEREYVRRRAFAFLNGLRELLEPIPEDSTAASLLQQVRDDKTFSSVRDQPSLEMLPDDERQAWGAMWSKLGELAIRSSDRRTVVEQ
jgi:tetratricopeptide (TPR) repeat protein